MLAIIALAIMSPAYAFAETLLVSVNGNEFSVDYKADGISILGVFTEDETQNQFATIILTVEVTGSSGVLEMTFDRSFFDSQFEGIDDEFFVLEDGFDIQVDEIVNTSEIRTIKFEVTPGTEEVEIIGTAFGEPESAPEEVTEEPETVVEEPEEVPEEPEPVVDEPEVPEPKTQCGPGTVLKNGVCVLESKCGPGTVLQDGVCVVTASPSTWSSPFSRDLIVGSGVALGIALFLIIIFAAISRASRSKNSEISILKLNS